MTQETKRYIWLNNVWELGNGGGKATRDTHLILEQAGWTSFETTRTGSKPKRVLTFLKNIAQLYCIPKDSVLFVQLPQHGSTGKMFLHLIMNRFKTIALLHDLDHLRGLESINEDIAVKADYLVSTGRLADHLPPSQKKQTITRLKAWDYLLDPAHRPVTCDKDAPILYAGNLGPDKAPALYAPSTRKPFLLYGTRYDTAQTKVKDVYMGRFDANNPAFDKPVSFGLVWENNNPYERLNQPHKFSLYLACGLPLIVWKESFIAGFVQESGCGICIESLDDIDAAKDRVTPEQYAAMRAKAQQAGIDIRTGQNIKDAMRALGF